MANLIIKPAGNGSLILQDEGGDAALTVGTTGSTTLAGTTNNLGTVTAGTLGSAITFPAGHVVKVNAFNDMTQTQVASGHTGAKLVEVTFTAKQTNSAYYFGMTVFTSTDSSSDSGDAGDRAFTAWLEDTSAGNKYRFGYRNTSPQTTTMTAANDYYVLADADASYAPHTAWNQSCHSWAWCAGNQPAEETTTVVSSAFAAGSTVKLQVWGNCLGSAMGYNRANYGSTNSASRSQFNVIEVAT